MSNTHRAVIHHAHGTFLAHPRYRPDIDGLRALAVLAVVGFHAFPGLLKGGFVGVDVFFVISGYLISSIIYDSLERDAFSFRTFYARRIRRIFPALSIVLIASAAFGWIVLFSNEYRQLGTHIVASGSFVQNFALWQESGYFDIAAESKPLLHLWSLGIEEQFYILWPLLLWITWKTRLSLLTITITVGAVSLALNIVTYRNDIVASFYSPQTRFWELLAGSVLAYLSLHDSHLIERMRRALDQWLGRALYATPPEPNGGVLRDVESIIGALLIIVPIVFVTKDHRFPGFWAILPVVGGMLIIDAGQHAWFNMVILSRKAMVQIGLLSFPLYLWHWPLLSFARIITGERLSFLMAIVAVFVSGLLAWGTYRVIERPARFGGNARMKVIVLIVVMAAVVGFGYKIFETHGFPFRDSTRRADTQLEDLSTLVERSDHQWICDRFKGPFCAVSHVPPTAIIIGDSHAGAIYQGLRDIYANHGIGLALLGLGGCPPYLNLDRSGWRCAKITESIFEEVLREPSIKEVIITSRGPLHSSGKGYGEDEKDNRSVLSARGGEAGLTNKDVLSRTLDDSLGSLHKHGKRITFLHDVPELEFSPAACIDRRFKKGRECWVSYDKFEGRYSDFRNVVDPVLNKYPTVRVIDLSEALCEESKCAGMTQDRLLYRDSHHLSRFGAKYIAQKLERRFFPELTAGSSP